MYTADVIFVQDNLVKIVESRVTFGLSKGLHVWALQYILISGFPYVSWISFFEVIITLAS